jgi:bifunctional UDP-N-acetylglucosamine pyrophosphorylase/glucosamine-1-phosphate N-acetyltransferase
MITLINTGTYAFKIGELMDSLKKVNSENSQKEYYLTDCPKIIKDN